MAAFIVVSEDFWKTSNAAAPFFPSVCSVFSDTSWACLWEFATSDMMFLWRLKNVLLVFMPNVASCYLHGVFFRMTSDLEAILLGVSFPRAFFDLNNDWIGCRFQVQTWLVCHCSNSFCSFYWQLIAFAKLSDYIASNRSWVKQDFEWSMKPKVTMRPFSQPKRFLMLAIGYLLVQINWDLEWVFWGFMFGS